jgi:hypothetical protein
MNDKEYCHEYHENLEKTFCGEVMPVFNLTLALYVYATISMLLINKHHHTVYKLLHFSNKISSAFLHLKLSGLLANYDKNVY